MPAPPYKILFSAKNWSFYRFNGHKSQLLYHKRPQITTFSRQINKLFSFLFDFAYEKIYDGNSRNLYPDALLPQYAG
jgi:hypothetical protein